VIVATPGRLIDMMRNKYLDTTHLRLLVVDEADQMLDRGFVDNIKEILQSIPGDV
jgi:translation initiation factor 4A